MGTSVIVTSFNDRRVNKTINSLLKQSLSPSRIILVDSSERSFYKKLIKKWGENNKVKIVRTPEGASVAEARNYAIDVVENNIICFLDTDEIAPEHWLKKLTFPIINGEADFTGGPTKNIGDYPYRDYFEKKENYFYKYIVSNNPETIPMGNSGWKKEIFDKLGGFDPKLDASGEDWDINIRAIKKGFEGKFVEGAWVYHDQSSLDSAWKIMKKKYKYNVGGAMAQIKNDWVKERTGRKNKFPLSKKLFHPLEIYELLIKPFALLTAYHRCKKKGII